MNAGAYGGEMKDVLEEVTVLTSQGELKVLAREDLDMGYRTSRAARGRVCCPGSGHFSGGGGCDPDP